MTSTNPCALEGIDFVELTGPEPERLEALLIAFGFSKTMRHRDAAIELFEQGDIRFLLNREPGSVAAAFAKTHGPSICSLGWRVRDADHALTTALSRGAEGPRAGDFSRGERPLPAVSGIGGSLIYFVDNHRNPDRWRALGFVPHEAARIVAPKGFLAIDHLTNNVAPGTMQAWASFYKNVFGFTEVRYFDIRGVHTGLTSYALRSPCGTFCIPINEAGEERSQINEYLREYNGPGIQHLAFLTDDILASLAALEGTNIAMLDIDAEYYRSIFERVPGVTEDHREIERRSVLVDGDEDGYLLQIFTQNLIGPIFIEIIQRKNHASFGEGNFSALFRSIERDQARRGVFRAEAGV